MTKTWEVNPSAESTGVGSGCSSANVPLRPELWEVDPVQPPGNDICPPGVYTSHHENGFSMCSGNHGTNPFRVGEAGQCQTLVDGLGHTHFISHTKRMRPKSPEVAARPKPGRYYADVYGRDAWVDVLPSIPGDDSLAVRIRYARGGEVVVTPGLFVGFGSGGYYKPLGDTPSEAPPAESLTSSPGGNRIGSSCSPTGVACKCGKPMVPRGELHERYSWVCMLPSCGEAATLCCESTRCSSGWCAKHTPKAPARTPAPVEEKPKPIQAAPAEGSKNPRILGKYTGSDLTYDAFCRARMDGATGLRFAPCLIDSEASAKPARLEPSKRYPPSTDLDADVPWAWEHVGPRVR